MLALNRQQVQKGALLVQLDPSAAQKACVMPKKQFRDAKLSLEKIGKKPVTGLSLTQAPNAVTAAQDSLLKPTATAIPTSSTLSCNT